MEESNSYNLMNAIRFSKYVSIDEKIRKKRARNDEGNMLNLRIIAKRMSILDPNPATFNKAAS